MSNAALPPFAERVRRDDPDRFFAALLAPSGVRGGLLLLAAFDLEIASAARRRTEMAGPYPALVRLQWWRDLIEGRTEDAQHEVAGPLGAAVAAGELDAGLLLGMLEGREAEAEGVPDWAAWREAMLAGAGGAAVAAATVLGVTDPGRVALLGAAREAALMRPETAFLPFDESFQEIAPVAAHLFAEAGAIRLPPSQRAVVLPAIAARHRLARPGRPAGIGVQLAMLRVWLFG